MYQKIFEGSKFHTYQLAVKVKPTKISMFVHCMYTYMLYGMIACVHLYIKIAVLRSPISEETFHYLRVYYMYMYIHV